MSQMRVSVAMAVYNGEKYIQEQVDSILGQLGPQDELIISYDRSTDNTKKIIDEYAQNDSRVRVIENENPGVQNNFNNAVMECRGEYIFLSDQDDLWLEGKIECVLSAFRKTGAALVVHDGYFTDEFLEPFGQTIFEVYGTNDNPIRNIIKCTYWGCCMAFRADMREIICPFPNRHKVGHDLWLGVLAGMHGKIARVNICLIKHRIHGKNVTTSRRSLPVIVRHRLALLSQLVKREWKIHSAQ